MARVTGKYDVDFERGEGGFKSVFGTFIGTRLKENKEQYARQLKAADPTNEYKILKDLMEERRKLVGDMSRLRASPTGGGSVSVSETDPGTIDMAKYLDRVEDRNREDGEQFQLGGQTASSREIAEQISRIAEGDMSDEAKRTQITAIYANNMEKSARAEPQRHGLALGMSRIVKESGIGADLADSISLDLRKASGVSEYDEARYADPTLLTPGQKERLPLYLRGSRRTTSVRKQMGEGIDLSWRDSTMHESDSWTR